MDQNDQRDYIKLFNFFKINYNLISVLFQFLRKSFDREL